MSANKYKYMFDLSIKPKFSEMIEVVAEDDTIAEQLAKSIYEADNENITPIWRSGDEPESVELEWNIFSKDPATEQDIERFEEERENQLRDDDDNGFEDDEEYNEDDDLEGSDEGRSTPL